MLLTGLFRICLTAELFVFVIELLFPPPAKIEPRADLTLADLRGTILSVACLSSIVRYYPSSLVIFLLLAD